MIHKWQFFILLLFTLMLSITGSLSSCSHWSIFTWKLPCFFSQKFFIDRSQTRKCLFQDSFISSQLVIIPLLTMLVLLKYFYPFWSNRIFFSWLGCCMITSWPYAWQPLHMWSSWTKRSVFLSSTFDWLIFLHSLKFR